MAPEKLEDQSSGKVKHNQKSMHKKHNHSTSTSTSTPRGTHTRIRIPPIMQKPHLRPNQIIPTQLPTLQILIPLIRRRLPHTQNLMHDLAQTPPCVVIGHQDDSSAPGDNVLRHGERGARDVHCAATVHEVCYYAGGVEEDPG